MSVMSFPLWLGRKSLKDPPMNFLGFTNVYGPQITNPNDFRDSMAGIKKNMRFMCGIE